MRSFTGEVDLRQMTGAGSAFTATYIPMIEILWIRVPVIFEFLPGWHNEVVLHGGSPAMLRKIREDWQPGESEAWKKEFFEVVNRKWSGKHIFHCQRDWWEDL